MIRYRVEFALPLAAILVPALLLSFASVFDGGWAQDGAQSGERQTRQRLQFFSNIPLVRFAR
jgi:hypothetical protein